MSLGNSLGTFAFAVILVLTTLPAYLLALVGNCFTACFPSMQTCLARSMYRCLNIGWWMLLKLSCCWVRIRFQGLQEFRSGLNAAAGKPRCVITNHTCFMDSFIAVSAAPFGEVANQKAMAAEFLMKMPVIGPICKALGHLVVPFKSTEDGNMSVDKEKVAEIQVLMQEHVRAGNIACWYPEGQMNRGDPLKLQTFRAGGFALPAEVDCEIWCGVHVGNDVCWPRQASVGGRPAKIEVRLFRLCESSIDIAKKGIGMDKENDVRARSLYLAQHAQQTMQTVLDDIVSEGWASLPGDDDDSEDTTSESGDSADEEKLIK